MKKITVFLTILLLGSLNLKAQFSESGSLGVGVAWTSLNFGVSAKYNLTENHSIQAIVGSASFGFGFANSSSFSATGRYLYNFELGDLSFARWKPYLYGQAGYWTFRSGILNLDAVAIGGGGGVEWSFSNFIDGLSFSSELGFTSVSFDGLSSVGGFNGGFGIHYYFNL